MLEAKDHPSFATIKALTNAALSVTDTIKELWKDVPCSVCGGHDNVAIHTLMSREYPTCGVCVGIWYDNGIVDPEKLRELSLAQQGESK